ncbi:hypothetical protein GCM10017559_77410 [Streptosporangium longisporum]|uniref:Uncharacterized protein n=1 Tax=Streptosporangium longisporum TaxID=46187 RepID=A0ABP6LFV1_9ACTN
MIVVSLGVAGLGYLLLSPALTAGNRPLLAAAFVVIGVGLGGAFSRRCRWGWRTPPPRTPRTSAACSS